jgi:hypothetical protein
LTENKLTVELPIGRKKTNILLEMDGKDYEYTIKQKN